MRMSPSQTYRLSCVAWLFIATLISVSGCDPFAPRVCSLVGCTSELTVRLIGVPQTEYVLEIRSPGSDPIVFECDPEAPCESVLRLRDFAPESVEVSIRSDAGSTTQVFEPDYTEDYPNGPDCEPLCLTATIRVSMP